MVSAMKHDMLPMTQNHPYPAPSFVSLAEYDPAIHKIFMSASSILEILILTGSVERDTN